MAAQRITDFSFEKEPPSTRRYDWPSWTDGSVWQITRGEDYEVATENMRVNLHIKAKQRGMKVRTAIFREESAEGLRFQFSHEEEPGGHDQPTTDPSQEERQVSNLEAQWHNEMVQIHADAKAIGYNASYFIQMVNDHGGLAAAKQLINSSAPSAGFTNLWERSRLDITVEARALKPVYRPLFTAQEIKKCRERLAEYGWTKLHAWEPGGAS